MTPYIDAATGTHFNKLGIRNRDNLHQVEYAVTDLRIAELMVKPIPGRFDLDHLKQVHAHVFQDLYEWADKERTLNFSKRDAVSRDLKSWDYLKGLNQSDFTAGVTTVYVKLNYMQRRRVHADRKRPANLVRQTLY